MKWAHGADFLPATVLPEQAQPASRHRLQAAFRIVVRIDAVPNSITVAAFVTGLVSLPPSSARN
jgi:hypothetical protein